ncbi:MraY family glycosyltransferase [Maricaulis sp. CAU 1757]
MGLVLFAPVFALLIAALIARMSLQAGVIDMPNGRSSHAAPTPRGGGLGILAGFFAGLAILPLAAPATMAALAGVVVCSALAAGLGLVDDLVTLGERVKLVALLVLGLALAAMAGPVTDLGFALPWSLGLVGSALWVFTFANTVNFMDGSDGLMAAGLVPAALAMAGLGEGATAWACVVLAAALAGFAVFNAPVWRPRGMVFSGDVGSLGAAVAFAGLSLIWVRQSPSGSVYLVALLVLPMLEDALLTLLARLRAGENVLSAHRSHAYQLLLRLGWSHRRVAALWLGMSVVCALLAWAGHLGPIEVKLAMLGLGVVAFALFHNTVRQRARAAGIEIRR